MTANLPAEVTHDAVRLEGVLPLDWVETIAPQAALADVMADNATLLRALLMLDEPLAAGDLSRGDAVQQLERRVDLLLMMTSSALRGLQPLPVERPCVLSARQFSWASDESVGVGRRVWARVYLRHRIPLPLVLPGLLVEEAVDGEQLWHRLELEPLEAELQDDLERLVFRHHRRQVARQRAAR